MEQSLSTRKNILQALTRSDHGNLDGYKGPVISAARQDPEFLAHLISWNHERGAIRDAWIALPLFSLAEKSFPVDFTENSLAHLASLDPRNFVRAVDAAKSVGVRGPGRSIPRLVEQYVRWRESSFGLWESAYVAHRRSMNTLYKRFHLKPGKPLIADALNGRYPEGSLLSILQRLPVMTAKEALGHAVQKRIPMKVLVGALREKLKDTDALLAVINSMSPTELMTNAKMLERFGVKSNPALRAAFDDRVRAAVEKAPVQALLKGRKAVKAVGADSEMGKQLARAQEKQIAKHGVKGKWAIFGDSSGSMTLSIEVSKFLSGHLARFGEEAHLIFFHSEPHRYFNVTGWELERIESETKFIRAGGGTSIGSPLSYLQGKGVEVDGIVIVSDGGDNRMTFASHWKLYTQWLGREPTLYFFKVRGSDGDRLTPQLEQAGIAHEVVDLTGGVDFYSLPNLVQTMRTNRYSLVDEIMETPLKTFEQVFNRKEVQRAATATTA